MVKNAKTKFCKDHWGKRLSFFSYRNRSSDMLCGAVVVVRTLSDCVACGHCRVAASCLEGFR
jgi:hypothetical protein